MVSKSKFVPRLVIIEGKDKGKVLTLGQGTAVLGRSKADYLIQDPKVSRSHVAIHYDIKSGKLSFTDLKSLNGTLINGESVQSGTLHDGDQVQIGNTVFDCQMFPTEQRHIVDSPPKALPKKHKRSSRVERDLIPLEDSVKDASEIAREDRERTSELNPYSVALSRLKDYPRISPRARRLTLVLIIVGLCYYSLQYLPEQNIDMERDLTSARQLTTQGKWDEAILRVGEVKNRFPKSAEPLLLLGELYFMQEKYELALKAYREAHDLSHAPYRVHLKLAELYRQSQLTLELEEELRHLETVLKERKLNEEFLVELATLYLNLKQPEKAYILSKGIQTEVAPHSSVGYTIEAQSLIQQNRTPQALIALEKAFEKDPFNEWVIENIALTRFSSKDFNGALTMAQQWLKIRPDSTKALLMMAFLKYRDPNSYLEAVPYLERIVRALQGQPQDPLYKQALHLMGLIQLTQKHALEASTLFKQACEVGNQPSCQELKKLTVTAIPNRKPGSSKRDK